MWNFLRQLEKKNFRDILGISISITTHYQQHVFRLMYNIKSISLAKLIGLQQK